MKQQTACPIEQYLKPGIRVHLIGIGGVSMRPLGLVLQSMGLHVTGSDMNASVSTQELESNGIRVSIGHRAENIAGADCIIRSAAINNGNPEIAAARAAGVPVFERAEAWGCLMRSYKHAICVAGTHGKTTTTSMVSHIFLAAGRDPTIMIGGTLPLLGQGHRVGKGDTIIAESCEYCNSFLNFFPTTAVVLNIEADHLDFFKDLADVQASFRRFAQLLPEGGLLIADGDDPNTMDTVGDLNPVTFGMGEDVCVRGVNFSEDWRSFDVLAEGKSYCHLNLRVFGKHNAMNAIAACAVAWKHGIPGETAAAGLASFTGAGRRMEKIGDYRGAALYDDYAHHPGELEALITTAKSLGYKRIVCAFQPHTYTRTEKLFDGFVKELRRVDLAIVAEIYAAREQNLHGISSKDLAAQIPGSIYCATLPEVTECLRENAREGDLLLTVGAGDIFKAGQALLSEN